MCIVRLPSNYFAAVTMISTSMFGRHRSACTHARTGGFVGSTQSFQTALCASNSLMSESQTWAVNSFDLSVPAVCKRRSIRSSTCFVCVLMSPAGSGVTPHR